ncbi:hypothetical protein BGW42_007384 [Actinomortierella wolfii]|nr:hypothetical protein BGW42_007384 [Actinomortierella wolfii]
MVGPANQSLHEQAQHPLLPTTTSRPEPAPENLLTKGESKRSWAALETEFVDSNDINGMAPSSAILRADHLVIDDHQILADKANLIAEITEPIQNHEPASKRLKASLDQPSAADLAALGDQNAVIQPTSASFTHIPMFKSSPTATHPFSASPRRNSATSPPPFLPQPNQEENQAHPGVVGAARKRTGSISSRGRMVAQLAPPANHSQPFIERRISQTIGDPIDTTRATVPMSIYLDPGPPPASMMPLMGGRKSSLRPGKDTSIEKLDTWYDDVTMTSGGPFGTKVTATAATTTSQQNDSDVVMTDTSLPLPSSSIHPLTTMTTDSASPQNATLPSPTTATATSPSTSSMSSSTSGATTERPANFGKTRRLSTSLMMSATHPFGQPKKSAAFRPVRIQILDDAETAKIREVTEQAQREQDPTIQLEIDQEDERHAEEELILLESGQKKYKKKKIIPGLGNDEPDEDIVLPIEDPVTHDWDREELEDDGGGGGDGGGGSDLESINSHGSSSRRRRGTSRGDKTEISSHQAGISRTSGAKAMATSASPISATNITDDGDTTMISAQNDEVEVVDDEDEDEDEDDDVDTDNDPEQQLPAMSEMQEEETHNSHIRLETQADFQQTAGLDRGELDASAYDEDGRYIGCIEQDDEGASEYENR